MGTNTISNFVTHSNRILFQWGWYKVAILVCLGTWRHKLTCDHPKTIHNALDINLRYSKTAASLVQTFWHPASSLSCGWLWVWNFKYVSPISFLVSFCNLNHAWYLKFQVHWCQVPNHGLWNFKSLSLPNPSMHFWLWSLKFQVHWCLIFQIV